MENGFYTSLQIKQCKIENRGQRFSRKMFYALPKGALMVNRILASKFVIICHSVPACCL